MTTRLTIVGNSHVAALKRAWDAMESRPAEIDLRFFASPDRYLRHFRLGHDLVFRLPAVAAKQRPLIARSARQVNGATEIDLSGSDAVVLYGGVLFQCEFAEIIATYDVDGYRAAGAPRRMSRAAFEAVCDDLAEAALPRAFWLRGDIARFAVFPRPLPSEGAATAGGERTAPWRDVAVRPEGARAMVERLFVALGAAHARRGIDFLRQPASTLEPSGMTSAVYSRDSHRLIPGEKHSDDDVTHMNARYGALCLATILDWARKETLSAA